MSNLYLYIFPVIRLKTAFPYLYPYTSNSTKTSSAKEVPTSKKSVNFNVPHRVCFVSWLWEIHLVLCFYIDTWGDQHKDRPPNREQQLWDDCDHREEEQLWSSPGPSTRHTERAGERNRGLEILCIPDFLLSHTLDGSFKANQKETEVSIPAKLHNSLIGSKGSLVRSVMEECGGVHIHFPAEGSGLDKVTIRGPADDVEKAKRQLLQLAEEKVNHLTSNTVTNFKDILCNIFKAPL